MRCFECLADGHHVDDAGNLTACTHVGSGFVRPGAAERRFEDAFRRTVIGT